MDGKPFHLWLSEKDSAADMATFHAFVQRAFGAYKPLQLCGLVLTVLHLILVDSPSASYPRNFFVRVR